MEYDQKLFTELPYMGVTLLTKVRVFATIIGAKHDEEINTQLVTYLRSIDGKDKKAIENLNKALDANQWPIEEPNKRNPLCHALMNPAEFKPDLEAAEEHIRGFLKAMGQDITREGLQETPKRYVKFMDQFLRPPIFEHKTFEGDGYDEMVISRDIPFHSLCEHHLAPFFGTASIAYIPGKEGRIVGISKLPRTLEAFASRLQNQERITMQVANLLMEELGAKGVAVVLSARHLCQEMRGVKKCATTDTSCMLGVFKTNSATRHEFLSLISK